MAQPVRATRNAHRLWAGRAGKTGAEYSQTRTESRVRISGEVHPRAVTKLLLVQTGPEAPPGRRPFVLTGSPKQKLQRREREGAQRTRIQAESEWLSLHGGSGLCPRTGPGRKKQVRLIRRVYVIARRFGHGGERSQVLGKAVADRVRSHSLCRPVVLCPQT